MSNVADTVERGAVDRRDVDARAPRERVKSLGQFIEHDRGSQVGRHENCRGRDAADGLGLQARADGSQVGNNLT